MAVRKNTSKKNENSKKITLGVLFWVAFFIVIALLFAINLPLIQRTLKATQLAEKLTGKFADTPDKTDESDDLTNGENTPVIVPNPQTDNPAALPTEKDAVTQADAEPTAIPVRPTPAVTQGATRERTVYFVKVDTAGMVFTQAVKRSLPSSETPLLDSLNAMLQGPSAQEEKIGLTSLIPEGTRILSARIQGNTAFINFNESFMFNSFGAEGYIAQLRQVVWTATEFPNIDDVLILIDGRRIEFLGESIRIGRAISRNSL